MDPDRRHVFAVNGSTAFLNLVRDLFQEAAFAVTTANFVPNSFAQIAALQPDALIVDVAAGERVGWALLERLHAEAATTGIPVLVVSADPGLLARARAHRGRFGGTAFLAKRHPGTAYLEPPVDGADLVAAVRGMLGPARAPAAARPDRLAARGRIEDLRGELAAAALAEAAALQRAVGASLARRLAGETTEAEHEAAVAALLADASPAARQAAAEIAAEVLAAMAGDAGPA